MSAKVEALLESFGVDAVDGVYTYRGYRYQTGPDGVVWVWRLREGEWRPQAFRVFGNRLPVMVPDAVWEERREELTASYFEMCAAAELDPAVDDLQVRILDAVDALGGPTNSAAQDGVEAAQKLTALGWCPGWPAAAVERNLEAHKALAWSGAPAESEAE